MRVGVIGTGFGARVVAPAYEATPGVEVVQVVSARDGPAVSALCQRADVDLVSIHSPPFLHADHVRQVLRGGHGTAVLCDKPLGLDSAESSALLAEVEQAGVVHLVNFEFRFHPARLHLRRLLGDGAIGRPEHLAWTHFSAGSRVPLRPHGWLFERARGGGWVGAWGSHAVDSIRWWLGEITAAAAALRTTITERPLPDTGRVALVDVEDGLTAWLTTEQGATAALDSSFAAPMSLAPRLVIAGSAGVIEDVADERVVLRRPGEGPDVFEVAGERSTADRHHAAMVAWAAVVRDAVRHGEQVSPSFADGHACDRVLDQLRSARRQRG